MHIIRFSAVLAGVLATTFSLYGCAPHQPTQNQTTNTVSQPQTPPYDYNSLVGFQPVLPTQSFQLKQISSYVFKYVNAPWGKVNPQVMETWGNGTAYDAMYISPNGTGKSFTVMETSTDSNNPPNVGSPWKTVKHNGITFFENDVKGFGGIVATIKQGVLYVVTFANSFTTTQLEQILESLSIPVKTAPELIKTQTFGFQQAPTAVPFSALIPKSIPFKWDTRTAFGEDVKTHDGKDKQEMGRLTLTYSHGQTQLKILEAIGMKYINPNIAKAPNGIKVTLSDGNEAVYIDGGSDVSMVDGGSPNRKVLTWNLNNGVNLVIVCSMNLTEDNLIEVANSLETTKEGK
ncbi:hypothetical protein [Alicyclobacillus tolerans]|uniref:DUF4367 domain-containing protein n=1 Tax=Alicyclobacillus tolerans TaxID=90970 RepID=A0A1M6LLQ4_9BACL|nr:hypothetical protein [Alicyclobacillus montanus]SHJ72107.1 hypothetical protein SAMN05443507_10312 [Alicyclobacillus montanus]